MDLDGETSHTYTLQYASSEEYPGYLFANTETNGGFGWNNVNSTVRIVDYKDGTCDFTLLNFSYYEFSCNGMQNFGDIAVKGATVTTDASGVRTIEGELPEMLLDSGKEVSGKLNGTIDADGNVDLNLDLNWHNVPDSSWWYEEVLIIEISFSSDLKGEEIDGYLYIVEGEYGIYEDDYKNPIAEKMPVTLLSAQVTRTDKPAYPPIYYRLVLKDVTFKNATADITVPYIRKGTEYPQFDDASEIPIGLPDGSVTNYHPYCKVDGGTTDGVHYEIKFTMGLYDEGTRFVYLFCFTTDPVTAGIDSIADGEVAIYGADGRLVKSAAVDGHAEISVAGGFYVVRAGEVVKKVIVK